MKLLVSILFLFALASVAYGRSMTWGAATSRDMLLSRELVKRVAQRSKSWDIDVEFPQWPNKNNRTFSAIIVHDNFRNNSGANPTLRSGGIGTRFCVIHLRGNYNQGVDSTVEVWGRR